MMTITLDTQVTMLYYYYYRIDHILHIQKQTHTQRLTLVILMMTITLDTQVAMLYYYRKDHILHIQKQTHTHRDSHW